MQNDLGDSGVQVLSRSLLNNQTVSNLNLCGNGLGPDAAAALAEVLRVNRSLKNIGMNLPWNRRLLDFKMPRISQASILTVFRRLYLSSLRAQM
jgi:hypothetical protein